MTMTDNHTISPPDTAGDLTALAGWIDEQLGDETADRQWIAESAAARVRDITLQMTGAAELARLARPEVTGPFETAVQVRELPAVRAIYDAMHASTHRGIMAERGHRLLDEACTAAGVELGAYDHRILVWLAGFEPEPCAVVAGLITRAAAAGDSHQRAVLGQALADAITYRDPAGSCSDCGQYGRVHCADHAEDTGCADGYRAVARQLGIEVER
jgi:hypothetical protein